MLKKLGKARSASPISAPRLAWFDNRLSAVLRRLEDVFPVRARSSSSSPPSRVRVRTMPVPPQWYSYPWVMSKTRILQLEDVVRNVVSRVASSPATVRTALLGGGGMFGDELGDRGSRREKEGGARHPHGGRQERSALNRASVDPPPPPPPHGEVVPPAGVAFSNWAEMIRSADQFLDHIHPGPIPGSWLWADMMLHGEDVLAHLWGAIRADVSFLSRMQSSGPSPQLDGKDGSEEVGNHETISILHAASTSARYKKQKILSEGWVGVIALLIHLESRFKHLLVDERLDALEPGHVLLLLLELLVLKNGIGKLLVDATGLEERDELLWLEGLSFSQGEQASDRAKSERSLTS